MAEVSAICCQVRCITLGISRLINRIAGRSPTTYPDSVMLDEIMEFHDLGPADCGHLFRCFTRADKDDSGAIELEEFFELLGGERDVYGDYLFQLIDVNGDGGLDFEEFVLAVCTYCGFAHEDILKFIFYIFDPDKSGFIENDELKWFCKIMHDTNPDMKDFVNVERVLELFDTNKDGRLDFAEFTQMDRQYAKVTFPAYQLQTSFAQATLGVNFFEDRKWYREQQEIKAQKDEAARRRAQQREREKAKRERKERLIKRKMGSCRYYFCCCEREAYYQIAIGDRDGRPDFENPVIKAMTTRKSRFTTPGNKESAEAIFEKQMNAAYEKELLKARREREKIAQKHEADKQARQKRRSKRNRSRHTTANKRGYPSLSSKGESRSKFELEYRRLKAESRVAPEEVW